MGIVADVSVRPPRLAGTAAVVALALLAGSCGHPAVSDKDAQRIRSALQRWASASTPVQACDVMSSGFRFFVGDGDFMKCPQRLVAVLGPLGVEHLAVQSMRRQDGQVAVRARVVTPRNDAEQVERTGEQIYWFVWQRGAWRLNSIGDEVGLGPPCHTYPGHPC